MEHEQIVSVSAIAHVIQLSVTPVFLLLCLGSLLGVVSSRLGRVIDRAHVLEGRPVPDEAARAALAAELATLSLRAKLAYSAVTLFTLTAALVCAVIATLFLCAFVGWDASGPIAFLFIGAMLCLFAGLISFLREVRVATSALRIGLRQSRQHP